ncbi:toll-like receptor 18 [Syngnathus scovelli]|uniref:toll-like receptor 18 n=1 Tax=Syngnathus scovelli TaxID=161590 RepID=UPI00211078FE|nr:toll-like receptor 18 [Syngnathus scovelli]
MLWTFIVLGGVFNGGHASPTQSPSTLNGTTGDVPCRFSNGGRVADCLGSQLESVPWRYFPSTLEDIDLSYNKLQAIRSEDFAHLPRLRVLKLQFNNISRIHDDAFKNNDLLEHLNIFNNSLGEIPASVLTSLLNLKFLYMSNNLYKRATLAEGFSRLAKLQVLSLGGPLVEGLKKEDFDSLKNIKLQTFAIKCSSNLSYYEPGSLRILQTAQIGFDMAIDQRPGVLRHMLRDLANKTFGGIQFRNLFEFSYYTGDEDIFQGLSRVAAYQLVFHRGKFNENLLRMALTNLQEAPIKRVRFQYIDFARSPTFIDSGAKSSITNLHLETLDLWYISNPDVLRFDWRFSWFNNIRRLSIGYVYFNSVPCDAWVEMNGVEVLDVSNNRLRDDYVFNQLCDYRGSMSNLHTFNLSTNELVSLRDLSMLTRQFRRLQVLDFSRNQMGSAQSSQGCVWQENITRVIAHHNQFTTEGLDCLPTTVHFLDLSSCNLDQLNVRYFEKAVNLKELLLSDNKIKFIPSKWESPSLFRLALDGNSFGLISKESFQLMPGLSDLRAGNNPYHCTCELHAFIEDTKAKGRVNLTDWPENYKCYHPEPFLNTVISKYLPSEVACDVRLVIIISVTTTAAVILILMLLCYIFDLPWYTKATYQIIRAKYRARKERAAGEAGPFVYHAFISYSHWDAEWVREHLLPCLENNRNPYRLCIHERDFMPGRWIIDNIIENIESSRKVIFVLSRHFVNSEWCNYELYFAQQRAMGKTFSDVILVVKEPIDPSSLPSKYCKLKKMLSTKTYLEWPQQANQQAFFWAQLRSVLGRPTRDSIRSKTLSVGGHSTTEVREPEVPHPDGEAEYIKDGVFNERQIPVVASSRVSCGCCVAVRKHAVACVAGTERVDKMGRQLEKAIEGLITIFHSYSSKEGDKHKLSKAELKTLLQEELTDFMSGCSDASAVDKIMTDLDENGDQQLDFQEFVVLVAALTVACNEYFEGTCKN